MKLPTPLSTQISDKWILGSVVEPPSHDPEIKGYNPSIADTQKEKIETKYLKDYKNQIML